MQPINHQGGFDPNDPSLVRVTGENVRDFFERVTASLPRADGTSAGPLEPGWRCKTCGWTVVGIAPPPPHNCKPVNTQPLRKLAVFAFSLQLLIEIMKNNGPVTFQVNDGLPADAKIIGANVDAITGTIQLIATSESFPNAGVDEQGQAQLPVIMPAINFTMVAVVPTIEMEEEELDSE